MGLKKLQRGASLIPVGSPLQLLGLLHGTKAPFPQNSLRRGTP